MKTLIALLLLLLSYSAFCQAPAIRWQTTIGCNGTVTPASFIIDRQGNYVIAGTSYDSCDETGTNFGWGDGWIIKTDSLGNKIWSVTLGGSDADEFFKVIQTSDSGYVAVGRTRSNPAPEANHGLTDCWIVKVDYNGNILWQHTYGGPGYDAANDVVEAPNRGLLVAADADTLGDDVTNIHGTHRSDAWMLRLKPEGLIEWQKCYGGSNVDFSEAIAVTSDNNYIITGTTGSNDGDIPSLHSTSYPRDMWVMKMDDTGRIIWSKTYGGTLNQYGSCIINTNDGGYLIGAESTSSDLDCSGNYGDYDLWAVKLDDTGKIQWQKNYGGSNEELFFTSLAKSMEGGYLFAGVSKSNDFDAAGLHGQSDILLIKTDDTGAITWSHMYGGNSGEAAGRICQAPDSTYVIEAITNSHNGDVMPHFGNSSSWLFKLGKEQPASVPQLTANGAPLVFPTITTDVVTIKYTGMRGDPNIILRNMNGTAIQVPVQYSGNEATSHLSALPAAPYILRISTSTGVYCYKLLLVH